MTAQTLPDFRVWGWPDRRRHDLERSHHVADHLNTEDRDHARRLVAQLVEYEQLARAVERQGGTAEELERIEDACWPVREVLRQLDEKIGATGTTPCRDRYGDGSRVAAEVPWYLR